MVKSINNQILNNHFYTGGFYLKRLELDNEKCWIDIHLPITDQHFRFELYPTHLDRILKELGKFRNKVLIEIANQYNEGTKYKCKINVEKLLDAPAFIDCFIIENIKLTSINEKLRSCSIGDMFDKGKCLRQSKTSIQKNDYQSFGVCLNEFFYDSLNNLKYN